MTWTFLVLGLAAVGVLGDSLIKIASRQENIVFNGWFVLGALTFALTAFGWVYAMKHMKLAEVGVIYSLGTVIMLAVIGSCCFGEKLNWQEWFGIALAIAAIILLRRVI